MNKQKFAVFDIDGTFFRWQLFHEIVLELIENGDIPAVHRTTIDQKMREWKERTHHYSWREYETAVVKTFINNLKGLPVASIASATESVLKRSGNRIYTYTRDLMMTLKAEGYVLIALSGSQDEVVQQFAKQWKFDIAMGQIHESKNGFYTGRLPNKVTHQKGELLKEITAKHQLSWQDSIGVGDSGTDVSMLELVEYPIAFNPTEDLFAVAKEKGWKVVVERKNMIYELEESHGTYILAQAGPR